MTERSRPSLADVEWPVRTERLLLRPAAVEDLEVVWEWRGRPGVARFMTNTSTDAGDYLERLGAPDRLATVLVVEHDGRPIMDLHVRVLDSYGQTDVASHAAATKANLGWSMDPDFGGRGLATEAVRAGLEICFDRLGMHRVEAECFADNPPSWRLMERVGMVRESHLRAEALHAELGWVDRFVYGILRSEWQAHHAH